MHVDKRNVFVDAGFQVFLGTHRHHVLAAYSVMFLQHGLHSVQNRADYFSEQFVLVPEIIVYVSHADTDSPRNLAHGGLGISLLPECWNSAIFAVGTRRIELVFQRFEILPKLPLPLGTE